MWLITTRKKKNVANLKIIFNVSAGKLSIETLYNVDVGKHSNLFKHN